MWGPTQNLGPIGSVVLTSKQSRKNMYLSWQVYMYPVYMKTIRTKMTQYNPYHNYNFKG